MVAPVNEFDTILQAETSRTLASVSSALILSTTANYVFVDGAGNGTPAVINMVATPISVVGTIVFSTSPSVSFTVDSTGKILTMNQSAMGSSDVTVTATLTTPNGLVFSDSKTVKRVTIGSLGYTGALNATANNTSQGLLSARPTGANGDFYFATDNLTLYQKIGGVWTAASTIGANASNFTGTLGGDNLMRNSSFELRAQAGSNRPSGYYAYNLASIAVTYRDVLGRTGGRAFALRADAGTASTFGLYSTNSTVEVDGTVGGVQGGWQANKTYIVSFKAKKVNGSGMDVPDLRWNTAPATQTWVTRPTLSTAWQTYTVRIAWGASVESIGSMYLDSHSSGTSIAVNDEFHVDELIVQEGDVYSEWFPSAVEAKAAADNASKSVFTPLITYDFTSTPQGWYGANFTTVTPHTDYITVKATNNDPMLSIDNLNFNGAKYDKIRVRMRRTGGTGWDGTLYYVNGSHGESSSYFGSVPLDPTAGIGTNWVVVEWDMAKSSNPADWASGSVTHLRLDFGSNDINDQFDVDWISIGRYGVGSDEAMAALSLIADDNVLSKGEKSQVIADWNAISGEKSGLDAQADALGVSRTAYDSAYSTLSSYLGSVAYNDTTTDTAIVGSDFRANFTNYYTAKQALLNAIAAKAATLSTWNGTTGRPMICRVVAVGHDAVGNNLAAGFYVESTSPAAYGAGRSYNLVVVRRSDRALVYTDTYDVFGSTSEVTRLKDKLNSYGSDVIVVIYTFDEPWNNRMDSALAAAMYRCGASAAVYGSPQFKQRSSYILVGIPGVGEGGGAEAYQGSVNNDPNAWCDVGILIDPLGNYQVSANYTPRSLQDYSYTGDMDATKGAPSGTLVAGIPADNVNVWTYVSGTGKPADNATADITLVARGSASVTGNLGGKSSGSFGWDSDIYSVDSFTGGAYASASAVHTNDHMAFGLNSDPTTDTTADSIDYAIWFDSSSPTVRVLESGSQKATLGAWATTDIYAVVYDGSSVKYLKNGAVVYTSVLASSKTPNQKLYFDSAFLTVGSLLKNIRFGPLSSNNWANVGGTGKPADNATVGATVGTDLGGQFTPSNAVNYFQNAAIQWAMIQDLRTSNYAEDGSGNPTAGAKMASGGTALKVANNSFQIGTVVFSDYWFRLVQAIDGNQANGRVIWRGNNDATTRGGAPDIGRLSVTFISSQVLNSNFQQIYHGFKLTPSAYSTYTDNLDAMQQIHVQLFQSTSSSSPFTEFYWPCPSRTYDGANGIVQGSWSWGWRFSGSGSLSTINTQLETNGLFTGCLRVRLANSYGWSATQDFAGNAGVNQQLSTTTITGVSGSSGGGSGGTSSGGGGACPAPWVKVRLINGTEVPAGDLHDGARVMAVNDSTMEALPNGGVLRDVMTIWKQRYRVKLADGRATEWSENHRFAVVDRGWVAVQNLRVGDHIMGLAEAVVESVLAVGEGQVVSYRVEGAGTYFAGGLLCHNFKMLP